MTKNALDQICFGPIEGQGTNEKMYISCLVTILGTFTYSWFNFSMPAIFIARQMIKQLDKQENCLANGETTGGMEKLLGEQWYFVSRIVLTHCEKKMF